MNIPAVSIYKLSVQQMTCYHVSRRHFTKLRNLTSAAFRRILAAFREPAAILRVDGTWNLTFDRDTFIRFRFLRIRLYLYELFRESR